MRITEIRKFEDSERVIRWWKWFYNYTERNSHSYVSLLSQTFLKIPLVLNLLFIFQWLEGEAWTTYFKKDSIQGLREMMKNGTKYCHRFLLFVWSKVKIQQNCVQNSKKKKYLKCVMYILMQNMNLNDTIICKISKMYKIY